MKTCLQCVSPLKASATKYCSNRCQQAFLYDAYISRWLAGDEKGCGGRTLNLSHHIYKYLRSTRGTACQICQWDEKHPIDGRSLTEVDHIDGDASNCRPENLRVLCPNCHSKTPTHRARNKSSARTRSALVG